MTWNHFDAAPRDGTPIIIKDEGQHGPHSVSVRFQHYDPEDAAEIGEDGYWAYCDELLNDAAPQGPDLPFEWQPDPAATPDKTAQRSP